MDVVNKPWGTQVWQGYELIMIMRAGTRTSIHKHNHYDTYLECLSGECFVAKFSSDLQLEDEAQLTLNDHIRLPAGLLHEVHAATDVVIREIYRGLEFTFKEPVDDIERVDALAELTALNQELGLYDDNTKNPLIKE